MTALSEALLLLSQHLVHQKIKTSRSTENTFSHSQYYLRGENWLGSRSGGDEELLEEALRTVRKIDYGLGGF